MVQTCCVPRCENKIGQVRMHRFPTDKVLFTKWVNNIKSLSLMNESQEAVLRCKRICDIHFGPEAVFPIRRGNRTNLKLNAVPTLFLPDIVTEKIGRGIYRPRDEVYVNERVSGDPITQENDGTRLVDKEANVFGSTSFIKASEAAFYEAASHHIFEQDEVPHDCPPKRPRMNSEAVSPSNSPNTNVTSRSRTINKMSREETTETLTDSPSSSGVLKATSQCTEAKTIIPENRTDTSSRNTNLSQMPKRASKRFHEKKKSDPLVSFDQRRKIVLQSLKGLISTAKHVNDPIVPNATRNERKSSVPSFVGEIIEKPTIPKFKTTAVQTEPMNEFDVVNKEEDIQEVSFGRSIDFLRRNLVGHVLKIKGNTFKIDECTVSLTRVDQDVGEKETVVVQPNKLISSSKLFLDSLLDSDRQPSKISILYDDNNTSPLSKNCRDNVMLASTPKKTKNLQEKSTAPDFTREVRVLLHKLPEGLVEAARNGHTLKVAEANQEIENEHHKNLFEVEEIPEIVAEVLSVEISEYPDFESVDIKKKNKDAIFENLDNLTGIGEDISRSSNICTKSPNEDLDKMEVVKEHTIKSIVRVNEFHCDMCNKKFRLYENRKEVQHKMDPNMKVECGNCKAQHYNSANSPKPDKFEEKCPECSDILPNKKELENHLLQNHRTVLKKDVYKCEACPKKFITYKSLMYHNETKHNLATVEDVVFKQLCEYCNELFESYIYKNKHLYECNKKYEKKRKQNSDESTDTKVEKTTAIQNDLSVMKRKSLLISNGNYNKGGKNANLGGESNKCNSTSEEPDGIINKLEALIGVNDGPNSITIINLDE